MNNSEPSYSSGGEKFQQLTDNPLASVIVVTRNRAWSLKRALTALQKLTYPNYEIIVVDNDSQDETSQVIESHNARRVFNPSSEGIGSSRRKGVEAASGKIIAFCDDDCVPSPQWLSRLVERLLKEPDIGLLGGQVINVGFPEQHGYSESKRYKGRSKMGRNGKVLFVEDPSEAEFFGNMNLAFRKEVIEAVGNYDPFFNVMEELDLSLRVKNSGYRIAFEPEAVTEHHYTGVHLKGRHFFFGPPLVRLYLCFKHYSPAGFNEWIHFLGFEMRLMFRECKTALRKSLAALRRLDGEALFAGLVECFNVFSSRAAIPWLIYRAKSKSANFPSSNRTRT